VSGPLLDWLEANRPELLRELRALVERGQVEILGGGYQEPMLAILPDRDALGQLERMADRCEQLLGQRPAGMWLAERVWEPDLARPIAAAGYRFTLLDDTHLRAAGAAEPLGAYYVTDKAGASIAVLPIDRGLRTRIPFATVDSLMEYLRTSGRVLTYGDDVEKFGLWPTTERRVWKDGWLERFFIALQEQRDSIETVLPSQMLAEHPSAGPIYIPTISYAEMGAWTLPPAASLRYQELAERLSFAGFRDDAESFLRGGIWQAFLAKYPESRTIYRKMLRVSEAVERARRANHPRWQEARDALYRGQCNCGFWHGLFGGLYLQHLRAALMSALLAAEELVAPRARATVERSDHDGDFADDLLFESPVLDAYFAPSRGGAAFELDLRKSRFCLTSVIGRHREAYHVDVARAQVVSDDELGNVSAHDLVRATEHGLVDKLVVDAHPRGAFVDHLLPPDLDAGAFDRSYRAIAPLSHARYRIASVETDKASAEIVAESEGFRLHKRIAADGGLAVSYRLESHRASENMKFASHVDVTLLSPDELGGRRIEVWQADRREAAQPIAPGARAVHEQVSRVRVACSDLGVDATIVATPPCELWRIPIETVSQSERGFESSYQGTCLVFVWPITIGEGKAFEAKLAVTAS
jgi:alpha-amylase